MDSKDKKETEVYIKAEELDPTCVDRDLVYKREEEIDQTGAGVGLNPTNVEGEIVYKRAEGIDHTGAEVEMDPTKVGELVYKTAKMSQSPEKQSIRPLLQQKLRDKPNIFLSKDNTKEYQKMPRHLLQKIISILETSRQEDPDYFWRDVSKANFLTFLYLHQSSEIKKKHDELNKKVDKLNRESLVEDSCNCNGLANKIWLLVDQGKHEEAENKMKEFEKMMKGSDAEFCELVSLGEVAYGFTQTEPIYYMHAIYRYEQVITRFHQLEHPKKETAGVQEKLISWKYHLAQTYDKLLNRGNKKILLDNGKSFQLAYEQIELHMGDIIKKKHAFYGGKATVDLVEVYKKVKEIVKDPNNKFSFKPMDEDRQMNEAYRVFKTDPYVLQMVGRHFQTKGENRKDPKEKKENYRLALKVLEEAKLVSPYHHVVWHHLGLTYRLLWLEMDVFPAMHKMSSTEHAEGKDNKDKNSSIEDRKLPKYQKNPTYSNKVRSLNPKFRSNASHSNFMKEAKRCMEKANKLALSSCCKYLVDLARIHISFDELADAVESFEMAELVCTNDNDQTYLYEQWGMLMEGVARDKKNIESLENVKIFYRKAIKSAVKAKVNSKMAFFNLRNIIREELESEERNGCLNLVNRLEYFLLYDTIEEYGQLPEALMEAVSKEERNSVNITRLVDISYKIYVKTKNGNDLSVASTYMTVIMNSECLNQTQKGNSLKKFLEITRSNFDTEYYSDSFQDFGDIFKWIVGKENLYQRAYKVERPNSEVCALTDICLVSPNDNNATANDLFEMFMKCNLEVSRYPDDAFPGEDREEKLSQLIGNSKMVLVVWEVADDAFKTLLGRCTADLTEKHACLISTGNATQDVEDIPFNKWPSCQWNELEDTNKIDMFHSLLSNILSKQ